jgi:hypothetical protein
MHRDFLGCKVGAVGFQGKCNLKFGVADKKGRFEITLVEFETLGMKNSRHTTPLHFLYNYIYVFISWRIYPLLDDSQHTTISAVFTVDRATTRFYVIQQFWKRTRCFLCGPRHTQCWVTGQWTCILTRDTCFPWGLTRVYITRVCI